MKSQPRESSRRMWVYTELYNNKNCLFCLGQGSKICTEKRREPENSGQ